MRTIPRKIIIAPSLNGYIVQVGCQTLTFNDGALMLRELTDYLRSPEEVEKRFRENALHRELLKEQCPEPEPTPTDCCTQAQTSVGSYPTKGLGASLGGQLR